MTDWVTGVDLAGPGNARNTALACFSRVGERLRLEILRVNLDDTGILEQLPRAGVVGLDAPLSYAETGGSRAGDTALRRLAIAAGLPAGSVMAPSAPRMVYLTLRGVALSRMLAAERPACRVVEVHPTVTMALRGAPLEGLLGMKKEAGARRALLTWLETQGLDGVTGADDASDHAVAACAAALGAWQWSRGDALWRQPAEPPLQPHDFAC